MRWCELWPAIRPSADISVSRYLDTAGTRQIAGRAQEPIVNNDRCDLNPAPAQDFPGAGGDYLIIAAVLGSCIVRPVDNLEFQTKIQNHGEGH